MTGATDLAGAPVNVVLNRVDSVETGWVASIGMSIGPDGRGSAEVTLSLGREAAISATAVEARGVRRPLDSTTVTVVNATVLITTAAEAARRRRELEQLQEQRYAQPIGDAAAPGAVEHRVLMALERLLITTPLRLPGVQVFPVEARPTGEEQRQMIDHVLAEVGWATRILPETWAEHVSPSRPWTAILCGPVWATDMEQAAALAWEIRHDLIALFGLNRGARGRPVATVIEQRQPDDSIKSRWYVEDARYGGNLLGGFVSGEDQTSLLVQHAALNADAVLRLCVDLYAEALADPSADAQYLRLWSVLETLSGARYPVSQPVRRLDGTAWPGSSNTTHFAAPRVYQLIAHVLQQGQIDEQSFAGPASDLYEAVRAWYARRNVTGHYGRLDMTDSRQQAQGWFSRAAATVPGAGTPDHWLMNFRHAVETVLHAELGDVGGADYRCEAAAAAALLEPW